MTKSFLRARDLSRDEKCPRDGCNDLEKVEHALFYCPFVHRVRKKLVPFMEEVLGVKSLDKLVWFFGLVEGQRTTQRKIWIMIAMDVRCWEVIRKAECEILKSMQIIPLFMEEEKMIIVHMYSPFANLMMVRAFLLNYCEELKGEKKF